MVDLAYLIEKKMAGRWIAGPEADDAIALAKRINKKGMAVMINYLGEDFASMHDVADAIGTYIMLVDAMVGYRINGDISVKPTSLGLKISKDRFEFNCREVVEHAKKKGIFVWLDMEGSEGVEETIAIYLKLAKLGNVGICLQSYLKRSEADLRRIIRAGGIVRLVKGAYKQDPRTTFSSKAETTESYKKMMVYLFKNSERFMIATHDEWMIEEAIRMNREYKRHVTYAMLNGIKNQLAIRLAEKGEKVSLYVPFGKRWVGFSYRRVKEGGHIPLILRSVFKNQTI
jgi:proline dehydrogenase